jgi:hypothetical protein
MSEPLIAIPLGGWTTGELDLAALLPHWAR